MPRDSLAKQCPLLRKGGGEVGGDGSGHIGAVLENCAELYLDKEDDGESSVAFSNPGPACCRCCYTTRCKTSQFLPANESARGGL